MTSQALKKMNADEKKNLDAKAELVECTFSPNPQRKQSLSYKK